MNQRFPVRVRQLTDNSIMSYLYIAISVRVRQLTDKLLIYII